MKWDRSILVGSSSFVLAGAVIGGHYAYYAWPLGWERSWVQWVGLNTLVLVLALLLLPGARRQLRWAGLAVISCWLAVLESGQAVACSFVGWGSTPKSDLCLEAVGIWPYMVASTVLAAVLIKRGRSK